MTGRNEMAGLAEGRRHITEEQFCDWLAGEMPAQEEKWFLGHIGSCTFCAQQFACWMEQPEAFAGQLEQPREESVVQPEAFAGQLEQPHEESAVQPGMQPEYSYRLQCRTPEPPAYLREEILQRTQQMDVQMAANVKERSRQMQLFLYSLKVGLAVMSSIFLLMLTNNVQGLQPEDGRVWEREQEELGEELDITGILNQKSGEVSSLLNEISNGLFRIDRK